MDEGPVKTAYIIPTGDEIREGIVRDTDSPELMRQILAFDPTMEVTRLSPVVDREDAILRTIQEVMERHPALVVLVGGSGGGHRFSKTLGKDYTHSALEQYLTQCSWHEIYGKNGHMWTKLLCGEKDGAVLINVPGPFVEAQAAIRAFLEAWGRGLELDQISRAMAQAVFEQYPAGAAERPD